MLKLLAISVAVLALWGGKVGCAFAVHKDCDGPNLLYKYKSGIAVSPNDPQCIK